MHHVVAAVLVRDDAVLLTHRAPTRQWYADVWDLPGGHVAPGEDEVTALHRELLEELGVLDVVLDDGPLVRLEESSAGLRLAIWVARRWSGTSENHSPEEHD